jgi:multiple sugar transport system substrate-binding protein
MMIYYNKVLKGAGIARPSDDWTWDDFLVIAKRLTSGEGPNKRFGFGIAYFNFGLTPFWYSNDTSVFTADLTESNLNDPKLLEAIKFVHGLAGGQGVSPDPANTDPNAVFQRFAAGKVAMTGHWPMQFLKDNQFTDFDVVPWPKNKARKTVFGADGWGISPRTKQKAIAWAMLKELAAAEIERQAAGLGVAIPVRRTVAESPEFLAQPEHASLFYQSLSYAAPVQAPADYSEVELTLMQYLGQVMANEVTSAAALKAAHEELSAAMKQQAVEAP